jgi:hypothetical protein
MSCMRVATRCLYRYNGRAAENFNEPHARAKKRGLGSARRAQLFNSRVNQTGVGVVSR